MSDADAAVGHERVRNERFTAWVIGKRIALDFVLSEPVRLVAFLFSSQDLVFIDAEILSENLIDRDSYPQMKPNDSRGLGAANAPAIYSAGLGAIPRPMSTARASRAG